MNSAGGTTATPPPREAPRFAAVQTMQGLASFSCGMESLCDELVRTREASRRQREESDRQGIALEGAERSNLRLREELRALSHENEVLLGQVRFLEQRKEEAEGQGRSAEIADADFINKAEEIRGLERDRYQLQQSLAEKEQKLASLHSRLESKAAVVDALSKELKELQAVLSRGLDELTDTKKHMCELARCQYENVVRLKQLKGETEAGAARNFELERDLEKERKGREVAIQARKDTKWELVNCKQHLEALTHDKANLESKLREMEEDKSAQASIAQQSSQIDSMLNDLQRHLLVDKAGEECFAMTLRITTA